MCWCVSVLYVISKYNTISNMQGFSTNNMQSQHDNTLHQQDNPLPPKDNTMAPKDDDKVEATSAILNASSHSLFHHCHPAFNAYMHCRRSTLLPSPEPCQHLARLVISCATTHYEWLAESPCRRAFRQFWRCLDNNDQNVIYCRGEERLFYDCVGDGLGKLGREGDGGEVRRLWRGSGPGDGFKEDASGAEEGRWPFQWHVWWYKNHKPND